MNNKPYGEFSAVLTIWPAASSPLKSSSKSCWYYRRFRLKKMGQLVILSL